MSTDSPAPSPATTSEPERYVCRRCLWSGVASSLSEAQHLHWMAKIECAKAASYSSVERVRPASDAPAPPRPDPTRPAFGPTRNPCPHCGNALRLHPIRWESKRFGVLTCTGLAASPAQEATPPRDRQEETITRIVAAMCFDAQSDTGGRRSNRHRGRHAAREILEYLAAPSPGLSSVTACVAFRPEASAPEPTLRSLFGKYPDARRATDDEFVANLLNENADLRATVAALTAERTELQQQLQDQGRTEKSEPPTAAAPNQPQEPRLPASESDGMTDVAWLRSMATVWRYTQTIAPDAIARVERIATRLSESGA